ncbi:hypothetical protein J7399_13565 [Shimia sp. R9_1]|uniref:hypothetical protein n=1 Tax=Shimia sp. R9_1 TaxID=2821111 RepID=UPI001AD959F2|nr:hypothetical protein [Shimia sp. R9_1]MBO9408462.1 hypothetical protein [Shimia sp. R9_1]
MSFSLGETLSLQAIPDGLGSHKDSATYRKAADLNFAFGRTLLVAVAMKTMFCAAAIAESQPSQSVLDIAFSANEARDTARLLEIVEAEPAILRQRNTNGVSLLEAIYLHYNDDLVAQSHLKFLEAFLESDWFGQEFDTEELFDLALGALKGVDRQLSDIALTPDMRVHDDRAPFIKLLTKTADAVVPSTSLRSQTGLEIILGVCDKRQFAVGQ